MIGGDPDGLPAAALSDAHISERYAPSTAGLASNRPVTATDSTLSRSARLPLLVTTCTPPDLCDSVARKALYSCEASNMENQFSGRQTTTTLRCSTSQSENRARNGCCFPPISNDSNKFNPRASTNFGTRALPGSPISAGKLPKLSEAVVAGSRSTWVVSNDYRSIIALIFAASTSIDIGLVIISIPGSRNPFAIAAFSA